MNEGTHRELKYIAEQVLEWVAYNRKNPILWEFEEEYRESFLDELRRIELCAQAVLDMSMFHDLYIK